MFGTIVVITPGFGTPIIVARAVQPCSRLSNGMASGLGSLLRVVGVGFYHPLGSRVWCRFGCPQAAILGLFSVGLVDSGLPPTAANASLVVIARLSVKWAVKAYAQEEKISYARRVLVVHVCHVLPEGCLEV